MVQWEYKRVALCPDEIKKMLAEGWQFADPFISFDSNSNLSKIYHLKRPRLDKNNQWEYMLTHDNTAVSIYEQLGKQGWQILLVIGMLFLLGRNKKKDEIWEYKWKTFSDSDILGELNRLGELGWILCGKNSLNKQTYYIFKRSGTDKYEYLQEDIYCNSAEDSLNKLGTQGWKFIFDVCFEAKDECPKYFYIKKKGSKCVWEYKIYKEVRGHPRPSLQLLESLGKDGWEYFDHRSRVQKLFNSKVDVAYYFFRRYIDLEIEQELETKKLEMDEERRRFFRKH